MARLLDLTVYNPSSLSDEDFLLSFVARGHLAENLLTRLREVGADDAARHQLILGQRGMGKTSLLRRVRLGVLGEPALSARLLPLAFREEQYNVNTLHALWCNCLDALADHYDHTGQADKAHAVDAAVAALARGAPDPEGEAAYQTFAAFMRDEGRRPLLMLDNIDLILSGVERHHWTLRRIMQAAGGPVVVGASATYLEASADPKGAFYDFFQITLLEPLGPQELMECLRRLAESRGPAGERVLRVLTLDPGRIRTMHDLTGGNPRTLVLLYLLLEADSEGDVFRDLERLLDLVTPLYKARVDDLAPQPRVVFDAVALHWDPITAAGVAEASGLDTNTASTQLDRMVKMGLVEKVDLSSTRRAGFQVSERFFNIWYLMRHASRRMRNRLRWLTEFLRGFYAPGQRGDLAVAAMRRGTRDARSAGMYSFALSEVVDEPWLRRGLNHDATRHFGAHCRETRSPLAEFVDPGELHGPTLSMAELAEAVRTCKRRWGKLNPEAFWVLLGGARGLSLDDKRKLVAELPAMSAKRLQTLVQSLLEERTDEAESGVPTAAWDALRFSIREGLMDGPGDLLGALAAAARAGEPAVCVAALHWGPGDGRPLSTSALDELWRCMSAADVQSAAAWANFATVLEQAPGRAGEVERALRRALEIAPENADRWWRLGWLLWGELMRPAEAEAAFRYGLEHDPRSIALRIGLAWSLDSQRGRLAEAEAQIREAIACEPDNDWLWVELGTHLNRTDRFDEARNALVRAVELAPEKAWPRIELGMLHEHLGHLNDAEAAYQAALHVEPESTWAMRCLAELLWRSMGRPEEAESLLAKAVEIDPNDPYGWGSLAKFQRLRADDSERAETTLRKGLDFLPNDPLLWSRLGFLLMNDLDRPEDAEPAFRRSIELDPHGVEGWRGLGHLLADHLNRPEEAEAAYRQALALDPGSAHGAAGLLYLLRPDPDHRTETDGMLQAALSGLPALDAALVRAYCALVDDNFGEATAALGEALTMLGNETPIPIPLFRVLAYAARRGDGDKLLAWFDSAGFGERLWPLRAAYDAFLHGSERLQDVNPEVRGAAAGLLRVLERHRRGPETGKASPVPKKPRQTNRRRPT